MDTQPYTVEEGIIKTYTHVWYIPLKNHPFGATEVIHAEESTDPQPDWKFVNKMVKSKTNKLEGEEWGAPVHTYTTIGTRLKFTWEY